MKVLVNGGRDDRTNDRTSHPQQFINGGPVNNEDHEANPDKERGNRVSSGKERDSKTSTRTHRLPDGMDGQTGSSPQSPLGALPSCFPGRAQKSTSQGFQLWARPSAGAVPGHRNLISPEAGRQGQRTWCFHFQMRIMTSSAESQPGNPFSWYSLQS